jgi:hypothetical protein
MTVKTDEINNLPIDFDKCEEAETKLLDILNGSELNARELAWVMGQLAIDIGASLEGISHKIEYDETYKRYFSDPTLGNAFMASGSDIHRLWISVEGEDDGTVT